VKGCTGLIAAIGVLSLAMPADGGQKTFVLREHLNQNWTRELVSFAFQAGKGQCHRDSLRLQGPGGAVACQLSAVQAWPGAGDFVRSGRVSFVADLGPLQTRRYVLHYGPTPVAAPAPKTDLRIKRGADRVEIMTSRFGVRLLLGKRTYGTPAPAADVPAPLGAMRLGDGTWFGGSHLYGEAKVAGYEATLTATGPVFAEVTVRYRYIDGNTLTLVARVAAGDTAVLWDMDVQRDNAACGWRMDLSRGLPTLIFPIAMEWFTKRKGFLEAGAKVGTVQELALDAYGEELVTQLTPWKDWWNDYTQVDIPLKVRGTDTTLHVRARDPGAWVEPAEPGTMRNWDAWQHKLMPLTKGKDKTICLEANLAAGPAGGARRWALSVGEAVVGRRLNVIKDYVLDWPRPRAHPHLYVSAKELAEARRRIKPDPKVMRWADYYGSRPIRSVPSHDEQRALIPWLITGDPKVAEKAKLVERLRRHLALLGAFDKMRHTTIVAALYDALIDDTLVPAEEKPFLRAQMAYLGYVMADPATWSIERGYRSYNPNMSVSYVLSLGIVACLLPDHPKAREWVQPAINRLRTWLAEDLGPGGGWTESAHYSHVTVAMMVVFAVAAQRAGFHDFYNEPPLKKLMLYLAKQYTPRDPQRGGVRVNPPLGRANAGACPGLAGIVAKATAEVDPDYSAVMQWVAAEMNFSHNVFDARLGGFEYVYADPRLPRRRPDWRSELFPNVGTLMRQGVGTPHEHYVSVLTNSTILFARPSEVGSILKVFSRGRPVGGAFAGGYTHRQELLMSRVMLARTLTDAKQWDRPAGYIGASDVRSFTAMPRLDYLHADFTMERPRRKSWKMPKGVPNWPPVSKPGKPPAGWKRQMLFVKSAEPSGPGYLVLRDTVTGGQPTMWQFWTLSEKLGTPDQVRDLDAFLRDKPGNRCLPARPLKGDRFTAVGQFGIDTEYFIAAPKETPRYTLRYGDKYTYPIGGLQEYQDLLNVRLPGDGHYFVVLFPRLRDEPASRFRRMGEGTVVRLDGAFGTDHVFLSGAPIQTEADGITFQGTAASLQQRDGTTVLALGDTGRIAFGKVALASTGAVTLRYKTLQRLHVTLPSDHTGTQVTLQVPGGYTWDQSELDGKSARDASAITMLVPPNVRTITLTAVDGPSPWPPAP